MLYVNGFPALNSKSTEGKNVRCDGRGWRTLRRSVLKLTGHMDRKERDWAGNRADAFRVETRIRFTIMMTHNIVMKWRVLGGLRGEWKNRMKDMEVWRRAMEMTT